MRFALPLFLAFSFLLVAAFPANAHAQDGSKPAAAEDGGAAKAKADAAKEPAAGPATKKPAGKKDPLPKVDPNDPMQLLKFIYEAFKTGKYAWAVGLILMLLTWFLSRKILKDRVPKRVLPWLAVGLSVGTSIAVSFASGAMWLEAISGGVTVGLASIGGWEALTKLFDKDKSKVAPEAAASEASS